MDPRQQVVELLAEVKLQEKRLEKARERLEPLGARIKQALAAGDRAAAERLALGYEDAKAEVARVEQALAAAKEAHEAGRRRAAGAGRDLRAARTAGALADALGKVNASLDTAREGDDALRALDEQAALADARLDLALDEAGAAGGPAAAPPPPKTPEDILRELEGR